MLVSDESYFKNLSSIEEFILGGEPLPITLLKNLQANTNSKIYNLYGPTETTVYSSFKDVTTSEKVTIGKPVNNTQIYILNDNNHIQPIGQIGEICIGGDGVGNGYYNDIIIDEGYHPSFDIHYTYGGSGGQIVYHEFTMIMSVYDSNGDLRILGTTTTRWSGNSVTSYRISDETLTGIYSALNTYAPNATDININYILESFSDSNYQNSLGTSSLEGYGYFSQLGSSPTFTNFSYEDINSTTLALTGNNQKIIKGYSNVRYTIDNSNKAVARSGGNIVSYEFKKNNGSEVVNTISYPITKTYNAYNENDLQVKATDSRGFYKIVAKGNNTIDYYLPSGTLTAQREGATTKGKLDFSGTYWSGNFGTGNNTIVEAFFRVKPKNGSWGNWFQISSQDISLNNGSVYIETATTAYGVSLTVGTEYEVEFKITDGISSSKTFNTVTGIKGTISNGNVLDSYYKTSSGDYKVGINKLVDVNGTELQVSGRMMVKPKQDQYSCILIESSNRNEASIQYTNQAGDKGYVAGYGTAGFDGFGIYSHGSGQNILGVNGTRDSNNNPVNTIKLIKRSLQFYLKMGILWNLIYLMDL